MVMDAVPPHVGVAVAGNYEPENNDDLVCPFCKQPSGWNYLLWIDNIPAQGLFCNNCQENFSESDYYNG